jgi:hypothetical protein
MADDDDVNAVGGHCPTCGAEYRPGFSECADDGTPLLPGPAPRPNEPDPEPAAAGDDGADASRDWWDRPARQEHGAPAEPPVTLGRWPNDEAWLVAGLLQSNGIEAVVSPGYGTDYTYRPTARSIVEVLVQARDADQAARIVREQEARGAAGRGEEAEAEGDA